MRFYVGVSSLLLSICILIFTILFFNYSDLFEKLFSFLLISFAVVLLLFSIRNLTTFFGYKRLIVKGLKVKARVVDVKRTIFSIKNSPNYILEVLYIHPKDHEYYKTYVDCFDVKKWNKNKVYKEDFVEIRVDPNDPSIALLQE